MLHSEYDKLPGIRSTKLLKLKYCPAAFWEEEEETEAMLKGRLFHSFLLQPESFCNEYLVRPSVNKARKAGKEIIEKWGSLNAERLSNPDVTIVDEDDFMECKDMVKSVLAHPTAKEWLEGGETEVCLQWTDQETGLPCKILIDHLSHERKRIINVKTAARGKGNEWSFFREMLYTYYHDVSAAMYLDGLFENYGVKYDYSFIVVEKKPPKRKIKNPAHCVSCHDLSMDQIEKGYSEYRRLMRLLKQCQDSNHWPAYLNAGATQLISHKE